MAKKLDAFDFKGEQEQIYPWSEWVDGNIWSAEEGTDFRCDIESFRAQVKTKARSMNCKVQTQIVRGTDVPDALVFQFHSFGKGDKEQVGERPSLVSSAVKDDTDLLKDDFSARTVNICRLAGENGYVFSRTSDKALVIHRPGVTYSRAKEKILLMEKGTSLTCIHLWTDEEGDNDGTTITQREAKELIRKKMIDPAD